MKTNKLFTFTYVIEYRGGTYCSQVKAKDLRDSFDNWIDLISSDSSRILHLGKQTIAQIKSLSQEVDNRPKLLHGLKNIWCITFATKHGFLLGNIILTETTELNIIDL
jgi:hypothetical protein